MKRVFWVIVAFFTAIAVHAGFMLAVPAYSLDRTISRSFRRCAGVS